MISTTSSDRKFQVLKELVADHVINYSTQPDWGHRARIVTGGAGVDRVIEIGGAGTFAQSLSAVRPGGEIAVIGFVAGADDAVLDFLDFFLTAARFRVLNVGDRGSLVDLLAAVGQFHLAPVVDSVHTFEHSVDASASPVKGTTGTRDTA